MESLQALIVSPKFKAWVAIIAAIVMHFTPDNVDRIIETLLGLFGISVLVLEQAKQSEAEEKDD